MKLSYKHKLFFYVLIIFALFGTGIIVANQLTILFIITLFLIMLLMIYLAADCI